MTCKVQLNFQPRDIGCMNWYKSLYNHTMPNYTIVCGFAKPCPLGILKKLTLCRSSLSFSAFLPARSHFGKGRRAENDGNKRF